MDDYSYRILLNLLKFTFTWLYSHEDAKDMQRIMINLISYEAYSIENDLIAFDDFG